MFYLPQTNYTPDITLKHTMEKYTPAKIQTIHQTYY